MIHYSNKLEIIYLQLLHKYYFLKILLHQIKLKIKKKSLKNIILLLNNIKVV